MKKQFFILLIEVFLLSEIILNWNKLAGFFVYIVLVGLILVALEKDRVLSHSEKLLIFLIIIPIARISDFFINSNFFWKTAVFYFVISFLIIFYTRKFKINPGYTVKKLWFLPLSIIIGVFLGYAGNLYFGFEKHPEILALLPFIAFSEEILFRGMIQNFAKKDYGSLFSIICTALLFCIFSLSFGFKFVYFALMANLLVCLIYDRTENIWLTIPINLFMNLFLFILTISR